MATKVLRIGKTFYVGNVHYNANCCQVKKAIQESICLTTVPIFDQVVIAKSPKDIKR